jgi:hypothetical protein
MGQGDTATVKNEGQVTLPEEVRSSLGMPAITLYTFPALPENGHGTTVS